jgi:hypothetical protein
MHAHRHTYARSIRAGMKPPPQIPRESERARERESARESERARERESERARERESKRARERQRETPVLAAYVQE